MYDSDDISTNPSDNRHFAEVLEANLSRRNMLGGAVGVAAVGFLAGAPAASAAATTAEVAAAAPAHRGRGNAGPSSASRPFPPARTTRSTCPRATSPRC